jgi:hypothetical protein
LRLIFAFSGNFECYRDLSPTVTSLARAVKLSDKPFGHAELMKALAVILGIFGASAATVCAQSIPMRCPTPSIPEVVRELDVMKSAIPPSTDQVDIYATLRSAETFQSNWLKDNKGQLQRIGTVRHGLEDVLLACWAGPTNYPRIKGVEMWDGALYELVIFELDSGAIASEESIRQTLLYIMKPPPEKLRISGPTAQALEDGFGFLSPTKSDTQRWQGLILRTPNHQVVGFDEEWFAFHEIDGRVFLVFDLGKRAGYAPWPQSIYLRDRFPPLSEVVKQWRKERLLQELTAQPHQEMCWDSTTVNAFGDQVRIVRDEVLVAEQVRRGLNASEFRQVMDSPNGRYLLVPALDRTHQTEQYAALIRDTLISFESLPDVNRRIEPRTKSRIIRSYLADLIRVLPSQGGADFSEAMLQLISSNREPEVALDYLNRRFVSSSNQAPRGLANELAKVVVPADLEKKRDFIVAVLRAQESAH